jgi:hypothetical protein
MTLPDISKALTALVHPRIYTYLAGLVPGLFFEISILAVCPAPIQEAISRVHLGYDTSVVVALFLAFVIGSAAILWVSAIQIALLCACKLRRAMWKRALERLLRSRTFPPRPTWAMRNQWLNMRYQQALIPDGMQGVQRAWGRAAAELLRRRYGIKPPQGDSPLHQAEVNAWYLVLMGNLSAQDLRGDLFVIALHATGWCGIAAIYLSPALRGTYYAEFSLFLIAYGALHDLNVARWWANPVKANVTRVRALLSAIKAATAGEMAPGAAVEENDPEKPEAE